MNIIESGKIGIDYSKYLRIQWSITNQCNYRCEYCSVYDSNEVFVRFLDWIKIVEIINIFSDQKETDIRIFGGEPTIHPDFAEIIRSLESVNPILIWTNLSISLVHLDRIMGIKPLRFRCTYHPKYSDFSEFYCKLKLLLDYNNDVFVNVMISPEYANLTFEIYDLVKKLKEEYVNFNCSLDKLHYTDGDSFSIVDAERFNREQDIHSNRGYYIKVKEDDQERIINIPYNRIIEDGLNKFYLYKCYTGPNSIYIDSNGNLYRCLHIKIQADPLYLIY